MIGSDFANRLGEMIFKETVDRTNRCAITGFMGTQMEESKRLQTGGSAEFEVGEKQWRHFFRFMSD